LKVEACFSGPELHFSITGTPGGTDTVPAITVEWD
jgi:hypothetical protein